MDTALTELVVKTCLEVRRGSAQEAAVDFGKLVAAQKSAQFAGLELWRPVL